jgi:hypothetical protein
MRQSMLRALAPAPMTGSRNKRHLSKLLAPRFRKVVI